MARERKFVIAGINIVTHPHSPQGYVDLFKAIFRLKQNIAVRKNQRVMIGELRPLNTGKDLIDGIFGRVYQFDQIDPDLPWFNVEKNEVATDAEMSQITIPPELKPNLSLFEYVFYPKTHKFYFISNYTGLSLSPYYLEKLFTRLFSVPKIMKEFGSVEVTVMPDKTKLQKILKIHRLSKLIIDVIRPNPDDNSDAEEEVFKRLDQENARRITQILTAEPHESIKPNKDTKLLATVAETNGKVEGIGFNEVGQQVVESTTDIPWKEPLAYDPNVSTREETFVTYTSEL